MEASTARTRLEYALAWLDVQLTPLAAEEVALAKATGRVLAKAVHSEGAAGARLFEPGHALRPQDLGFLSSIGQARVSVVRRPRVRLITTGDDLLPAGKPPRGHRSADANGPMLTALVTRDGGVPLYPGVVPDDPDAILTAMREECARDSIDIVIVSGSSGRGQRDHAPVVLSQHGVLAIHGIAMHPGSLTGLGLLDGRLVFLLPDSPVACLCAFDFFAGRAIRGLAGRPLDWSYRSITATLAADLSSAIGRVEYAPVRLTEAGEAEPLARSDASMLAACRADGFVVIPDEVAGVAAGAEVQVFLYD